jgi:hypothetical protein
MFFVRPTGLQKAANMFADVIRFRFAAVDGIGAGAVPMEMPVGLAFEGDLVAHPAAEDIQ